MQSKWGNINISQRIYNFNQNHEKVPWLVETILVFSTKHFARSNKVSQIPAILLKNKARQSKMKMRFSYDG